MQVRGQRGSGLLEEMADGGGEGVTSFEGLRAGIA